MDISNLRMTLGSAGSVYRQKKHEFSPQNVVRKIPAVHNLVSRWRQRRVSVDLGVAKIIGLANQ